MRTPRVTARADPGWRAFRSGRPSSSPRGPRALPTSSEARPCAHLVPRGPSAPRSRQPGPGLQLLAEPELLGAPRSRRQPRRPLPFSQTPHFPLLSLLFLTSSRSRVPAPARGAGAGLAGVLVATLASPRPARACPCAAEARPGSGRRFPGGGAALGPRRLQELSPSSLDQSHTDSFDANLCFFWLRGRTRNLNLAAQVRKATVTASRLPFNQPEPLSVMAQAHPAIT